MSSKLNPTFTKSIIEHPSLDFRKMNNQGHVKATSVKELWTKLLPAQLARSQATCDDYCLNGPRQPNYLNRRTAHYDGTRRSDTQTHRHRKKMAHLHVEDEHLARLLQDWQAPAADPASFSSSHDIQPTQSLPDLQYSGPNPRQPKGLSRKRERLPRVAFVVKSDNDNLCDGFKWRKYGQKSVKNSPYPRKYYRCINDTCKVKKRTERHSNDPNILVVTYEGQHDHHDHLFLNGVENAWFVDTSSSEDTTLSHFDHTSYCDSRQKFVS